MNPDSPNACNCVLTRAYRWQIPPHWNSCDWREELRSIADLAALEAERSYDPLRQVPLGAYVFIQVWATLSRYHRQEWQYACRCGLPTKENERTEDPAPDLPDPTSQDFVIEMERCDAVTHAFESLSLRERQVLMHLYWLEQTERQAAASLDISPASLHEYKKRALDKLRARFENDEF